MTRQPTTTETIIGLSIWGSGAAILLWLASLGGAFGAIIAVAGIGYCFLLPKCFEIGRQLIESLRRAG